MKNKFKSYRPVPPGKVLIFRYSRALGRTIPMFVDDTPGQWKPRSEKARRARSRRHSRTEKALPRAQLQLPHMSAVTVAPAPSPILRPMHPGAHSEVHDVLGAAAGAARALHQVPPGQSDGCNLLEMLGGALGGAGGTRFSAAIGQAKPGEHANITEEHANITEGLAEKAEVHGAEVAQGFRKLADELGQRAAAEAGPNGNGFARQVGFLVLEGTMRILAGAVNGAPAGARAHVALVNPTEQNIQRLTSGVSAKFLDIVAGGA
jgi:hypothetical protein